MPRTKITLPSAQLSVSKNTEPVTNSKIKTEPDLCEIKQEEFATPNMPKNKSKLGQVR